MDYNQETKFIFCPRCGGIMQPPVCNICGYDIRPAQEMPENPYSNMMPETGENPDAQGQPVPGDNQQAFNSNQNQNARVNDPYQNGNYQSQNDNRTVKKPVEKTPEQKKKDKKKILIPIIVAGSVLVILLILCGPIVSTVGTAIRYYKTAKNTAQNVKASASAVPDKSESETEEDSELPENADYVMRHFGRFDHPDLDTSFYESMADCKYISSSGVFDPYLNQSGYVKTWREGNVFDYTHSNHQKSTMGPDYYEPFCDSIDEVSYSEQYQISRKYFFYDDMMGNYRIQASVAYPELSGNIPNLDDLNQQIYDRCASDFLNYLNGSSPYSQYVFEKITFASDSYITYNDGKKMSILLDCVVHTDDYWNNLDSYIYAINIDLEKGEIIENDEIIDMDEAFAKEFRERCLTQNGSNTALDPLSDKEVLQYLKSKENNIMFFTPLGLEVGMHYMYKDDILARGWMTITLKYGEFEDKLKDPSLANTGNATRLQDDTQYSDLVGGWTKVDYDLGEKEEDEIRAKYPNYDWDEKTIEEKKEEFDEIVEKAKKEKENNKDSNNDSDVPDWMDDYEELQDYFNNPEYAEFKLYPDDYFKLHKGENKNKKTEPAIDESSLEEEDIDKNGLEEEDSEKESNQKNDTGNSKQNGKKGGGIF